MTFSTAAMMIVAIYVAATIHYVYRWRGHMRYSDFSQYLRKSWPVFAPLNCFLYLMTRRFARQPVVGAEYLEGISALRQHWSAIREEALALYRSGELAATALPASAGYHDIGFRTFYKRGWRKFYLKWYGKPHHSAQLLCPETVRILEGVPGIRAAMFSLLPAGAELTLHSDPIACSLRYHLGLYTPNADNCFICVDGIKLSWRDGEDFVFDETYPHYARNDTESARLILMCDVERPMNPVGRVINRAYMSIPRAMTVPNTREDRRGWLTAAFSKVGPWRNSANSLKENHRSLYVVLKYSLNATLLTMAVLLMYSLLQFGEHIGRSAF